jgi:hypothetical protein
MVERMNKIDLDAGHLPSGLADIVFKALPVNLTVIDENDEVLYFSNTPDRVFPRPVSIIGKNVENCHPEKSIGKVEEIIEAFKAGEHDVAEFWIQLEGRFIYIRYFALRDETDSYKGIVEVTQDVTGIRQLEGERRLASWG